MLGKCLEAGVGLLIKAPLLRLTGCKASSPTMQALQHYWSGRPEVLGKGFQDAFEQAMVALAWGLAPESFTKSAKGKILSNVTLTFAEEVIEPIFQDYCVSRAKNEEKEKLMLRKAAAKACDTAAQQKEWLLPLDEFTEPELAVLLNEQIDPMVLERHLCERLQRLIEVQNKPELLQLLQHKRLMLSAIFQFFREILLRDEQLGTALEQLRQEGIRAEVRLSQATQEELKKKLDQRIGAVDQQLAELGQRHQEAIANARYDMLAEIGAQMGAAGGERQQIQAQIQQFDARLKEAMQEWSQFGGKLDIHQKQFREWSRECSGKLGELRAALADLRGFLDQKIEELSGEIKQGFDELKTLLRSVVHLLAGRQGGLELTAKSFHTVINPSDTKKIQAAEARLQSLPSDHEEYSKLANLLGSALAAMGALKEAEETFEKAVKSASRNHQTKEEALAHYNLFQVHIQQGAHQKALDALVDAVRLDKASYLPFPMDTYTPLTILGAGGMGCAFLCQTNFGNKKVVVKIFWEMEQASSEEVFKEAHMMNLVDKDGEFVPKVVQTGFVNALENERPFVVMEYIDDSIDGEAYLRKHGKMTWVEGLLVGNKVARALEKAHQQQVCHLDLKPANLLFCESEDGLEVKIIDFGLARAARSLREDIALRSSSGMTMMAQQIFGTLDYAPPEQLGKTQYGEPGPHSDLYALAATMYRLLTCEPPNPLNPRRLSHTPHGFYELLCWCMEADPQKRPPSAATFIAELDKLKKRKYHPLLEQTLQKVLDDQILEDIEEDQLWTVAQFQGYDQDGLKKLVAEELVATQSRRMSAIWVEEWLQQQPPDRYPIEQAWGAMAQQHSHVYDAKGGKRTPWLTPYDHLVDDPAFGCEDDHIWLKVWEPIGGEQPSSDELEVSSSRSVGRFVREMAIKHMVWLQVLHPETGKPVADDTELQLLRRHEPKPKAIDFNGRHKVGKVNQLFADKYGLNVRILDDSGEPADPGARCSAYRLVQGKWAMCCGDFLFLTLQPPRKDGSSAWRDHGTVRFGGVAQSLLSLNETIPVTLRTSAGEFAATLVGEKNRFRHMNSFFEAYPALQPGDIVCLIRVDDDVFDVEIFWKDGAPSSQDLAAVDSSIATQPPASHSEVEAPALEAEAEAEAKSSEQLPADEHIDDPTAQEPDATEEGEDLPVTDDPERPPVGVPALSPSEKMSVGQFVKEFALDQRLWLQILDPETKEPLPDDAYVDDYRVHTPKGDELSLHGSNLAKNAAERIGKSFGLKVVVLKSSGERPGSKTKLGGCWLKGGMHLLAMGDTIFFTLKPPTRSGVLSWRQRGVLTFGRQGKRLFPKQENIDITLVTDDGEFRAALECQRNRFAKLQSLFRNNEDVEPGDVVCFTRIAKDRFEVEFFVGRSDAEVELDEEEEAAIEAEEVEEVEAAKVASQTALPASAPVEVVTTSEEDRKERFRHLITTANAAIEAGDLETAWQGYNELHFQFPVMLEDELESYRRVAAARFYQEGLEMIEDDPGFALRKFEGARALDNTLLPLQVGGYIEQLQEKRRAQRRKRFVRLCKKACQIAQADPEEALQLFDQAKSLTPDHWTEQLDQWVTYCHQLIEHRSRS